MSKGRAKRVRFSVEIERDVDAKVQGMANREGRSKRNFHANVLRRFVNVFDREPEKLVALGLFSPELRSD